LSRGKEPGPRAAGHRPRRGRISAPTPSPFLSPRLSTQEILARLQDPSVELSSQDAQAIRDRSAQLVVTDPGKAHEISGRLLAAVLRGDPPDADLRRAHAWRARAESSLFSGLYPQSREAYDQAVAHARQAGDGALEGQILVGFLHVLSLLGAAAEAETLGKRAERLLERAGDAIYLSKLHASRGNVFYQQDRHAEAYAAYRKAERAFARLGLKDASWASLMINQAIACTNLSRIGAARKIFQHVQDHCDREGLRVLSANARYNRSFLEALRGDFRLALRLLEEAAPVFSEQRVLDMVAACLRARAEIYLDLNMHPEACEWAQQAAVLFAEQDMAVDHAVARLLEARGLQGAGHLTAAAAVLEEVATFFQKQGNQPRWAATLLAQAEVAAARGNLRDALGLARQAQSIFRRLSLAPSRMRAERQLARYYLDAGQPSRAAALLARQQGASRALTVSARLDLWHLTGRISRAQGAPAAARRQLTRAAEYVEIQRQLTPGLELRSRAFERQVCVYHDLITLELEDRARAANLLSWMEAARARGFRERQFLRGRGPKARTIEARAALGSLIGRLHEAEFPAEGAADREPPARLRAEMQTLEKQAAEEARRVLDSRSLRPGRSDLLAIVARTLRVDEALIEYCVLGERVLALVVHNGRAHQWILPASSAQIQEYVDRVRFQLDSMALSASAGPAGAAVLDEAHFAFLRGATEAALRDLYRALIAPLANQLPRPGRWLVVPHQLLHRVPFESLLDEEGPILDSLRIVRCPSAEMLRLRNRRRGAAGKRPPRALICGTHHAGLEAVASELDAVAHAFPKSRRRVLEDPSSRELIRWMPGYELIHLTAHGVFREDNPNFSYLSTRDGALFLMDLYGQRLTADLITLSACGTGQAFTGRGDDLAGVAHGFLSAGARQLVASQWRVHDEATRDFMAAFYRHYARDASGDPAAALSGAAAEIRPRWNHPFYWGAFGVYGC